MIGLNGRRHPALWLVERIATDFPCIAVFPRLDR